jgi:glutaredoxin-like protein
VTFLRDEDAAQLTTIFSAALHGDVTLVLYTQAERRLLAPGAVQCDTCRDAEGLLNEVSATSVHLTVETHDFAAELEAAGREGIDKIPAMIIAGQGGQRRVRYFGLPSGYEFASFVEDILAVGAGETDLSQDELVQLAAVQRPVHIQVFTTPSCPYCPDAVRAAHRLAIASGHVVADMISVAEYPHLAQRYDVTAVPTTVINETERFEGAVPVEELVRRVALVARPAA